MKDKRNCGMPYPMYPQQMIPGMGIGTPMPTMPMMPTMQSPYQTGYTTNSLTSNTIEQQLNSMNQQINNLEQRVTKLENMNTTSNSNSNKYNNSNYYMV